MANNDIKKEIKSSNLYQWQVAEALKMHDSNFSKMLRHELPEDKKEKIRSVIKELSQK